MFLKVIEVEGLEAINVAFIFPSVTLVGGAVTFQSMASRSGRRKKEGRISVLSDHARKI